MVWESEIKSRSFSKYLILGIGNIEIIYLLCVFKFI